MTIASGFKSYPGLDNTTLEVLLMEDQWYHIPDEITGIPAKSFRNLHNRKPEFIGRRVYKQEFMRLLGSLERILIRAKFHTDQLEGT